MPKKIYGICMTKNEADIIAFCLTHASRFCHAVYVLDNGSTDDTWERVVALSRQNERIVPFERKICRYGVGLRGYIFNQVRRRFKPGDWVLILDSDEFLETDPQTLIAYCELKGFDLIFSCQAQFYITRKDLDKDWYRRGHESIRSFEDLPAHFQINWREPRLFKYKTSLTWPDLDAEGNPTQISYPRGLARRSRKKIVNRHYQYRSLPQMRQRLTLRSRVYQETGRFKHSREPDYHQYIRDHARLKQWIPGSDIRPTPFDFLRLYLIRRSRRFRRIINNRTQEKR